MNNRNVKMNAEVRGSRLLAKGIYIDNDTWKTGLNNNDVIIGPSGAGKTRGYVAPLLAMTEESIIVSDPKGNLYHKFKDDLIKRGFCVMKLDLLNCDEESCIYNPMDYIRYNRDTRRYDETDIRKIAGIICPALENDHDPFWRDSARLVIESLIAYVLECTPAEEHHFGTVLKLLGVWDKNVYHKLFEELYILDPDSYAVKKFLLYKTLFYAEKTCECVRQFVSQALNCFEGEKIGRVLCRRSSFRFRSIGERKTAFFINVSDCDRSQDNIVNIFYLQLMQELMSAADREADNRLRVPARIVFDDFAAGTVFPDFDKIISVIRSREISVSIILQSLSQLEGLYSHAKAMTIINNCDHMLYLGGGDVETARYISEKTDRRPFTILNMGVNDCYLFERGCEEGPRIVQKACIDDVLTYGNR